MLMKSLIPREKHTSPREKYPSEFPSGRYISRDELEKLIFEKLNRKLTSDFGLNHGLYISDSRYYCPPHKDAKDIIRNSEVRRMTYHARAVFRERFDCDDFSILLKARFAYATYRDPATPNHAHCFGVVWGMLPSPFPHSLNWMVTVDQKEMKKLWFVEPQTYDIFPPRRNDKNIYFMLV